MKATVHVTYKPSILDPQGEAIKKAVHQMGYTGVEDIRMGRYFELTLADGTPREDVEAIATRLLANPVMETFTVRFDPAGAAK
ncbi:phosphoribosylformylglycinamidine synthase subunit PurS [Neoactinobaculum massilliense]|uniref:phosphoribosylformylglycinamidine synthase subunit PurS n=1 Tax=Neoactinobaculum massilliense TaxID=2364794 RepID=UPI000F52C503|nr:phosphoribosylformylglycinamidine synthase subunit PurS [Neoactinobaculum massilliense]